MSDDEQSDATSSSDDVETTGLIATRAKRSTAGNLYASLRANLDDEELQKELLAEDEDEDAADYEGSDKGDDEDEALESSSDEEDAGPPQEGEAEDLSGEKELKKSERAEQRQKRKAVDARLKLPAWQKKKKVKLADDVKVEDGAPVERPKKKSERSNWLPTADDAPVRQSRRALAVQNREVTHANLKESYERSEKQRRVMKDAAEREKTKKKADLTQEERLKVCEKIERQTAKEFGRWEREEAERQRIRDEMLAAKRQRGIDGPVVRTWSGSAVWAGPRMVEGRCEHGSKDVSAKQPSKPARTGELKPENEKPADVTMNETQDAATDASTQSLAGLETSDAVQPHMSSVSASSDQAAPVSKVPITSGPAEKPTPILEPSAPTQATTPWLHGIHDYASQASHTQPLPAISHQQAPTQTTSPSIVQGASTHPTPLAQAPGQRPHINGVQPPPTQQPYTGWPPGGAQQLSTQLSVAPQLQPPPPPPAPTVREQAQRTLVILEQFQELENAATTKRSTKLATSNLEPSAPATVLLPESYPSFTPEESKYLLARQRRTRANVDSLMPPAPAKQLCAITSWNAKYRDPKTGLCYADMHIYKIIQRVLADGCQWSGLLGCWVGPAYGPMGRPARGVPEGFAAPVVAGKEKEVKTEGGADEKA